MRRSLALPALTFALFISKSAHAQTRPESIRGRVTTDSGAAIVGATVSATMAPDRTFQQATTDAAGRYTIHFTAGSGDYLIHASALGFKAARKRLTRSATDTALTLDLSLVREVTTLATVKVEAKREVPRRDSDPGHSVGAREQQRDGMIAALSPEQEGNLAARRARALAV
jgi:hypothetical protein